MDERGCRRAARAPFTGWVEITTKDHRQVGSGRDLSSTGICIYLEGSTPEPETPITSEFALPGISLPLAMEGQVVWRDAERHCIGVRFARIDPGVAELLERYVSESS